MGSEQRSGFRTIHTTNGDWQYKVGEQYVVIYSPYGTKFSAPCGKITHQDDWDIARWKKNDQITPHMVKEFIEKHLS